METELLYALEVRVGVEDGAMDIELRGLLPPLGKAAMAADQRFKAFIDKLTLDAAKVVDGFYAEGAETSHRGVGAESPEMKAYLEERGSTVAEGAGNETAMREPEVPAESGVCVRG